MPTNEPIWHTTVDETIRIFRDALVALLPTLQRARIAWRDTDSYDGWDNICQALFNEIVLESCRWATGDLELSLPKYNLRPESYDAKSFISIARMSADADHLAFLSLDPNHDDFASARLMSVNSREIVQMPLESCKFELSHLDSDGVRRVVRDLAVQL